MKNIKIIYVYIEKVLVPYDAYIRDLCMAFFLYKKIVVLYKNEQTIDEYNKVNNIVINKNEFLIIDNYCNKLIGNSKLEKRNYLKKELYFYLKKLTKKDLLWGTLTGIRPCNIVTELYKNDVKNCNYEQTKNIKKYLKNQYLISDEKIKLLLKISKNELKILSKEKILNYKKRYSVYIGVPFCKSTCLYCSFTSYNIEKYSDLVSNYLLSFENELINRMKNINVNKPMTIYVGGGTPTSFEEKDFEKFLIIIDKYFNTKNKNHDLLEYTIEAGRPDTITELKLKLMKEYGVTRISINPQTFNQKTLNLIGRNHTVKDVIDKYKLARRIGFNNINMDIIIGLPNEKIKEVLRTLIYIAKLKPDSLTIHSLALKRSARLNYEKNFWQEKYIAGLDETEKVESKINGKIIKIKIIDAMFKMSLYLAKKLKLYPYYLYRQKNMAGNLENIGFASKGKECIYNILMMEEKHSVYGFGCGSVSKIITYKNNNEKLVERISGYKSIVDYIKKWK